MPRPPARRGLAIPPRPALTIARVYDAPAPADDVWRVLIDRLWPRGFAKAGAPWDDWRPDVGPTAELRRWFGHDPARWTDFRRRYLDELHAQADAVHRSLATDRRRLVLLTASRDPARAHAAVLRDFLAGAEG